MEHCVNVVSNLIYTILIKITALFHIQVLPKQMQTLMQFVKFGVVGLSNTIIGYLVYLLSLFALRGMQVSESVNYLIANIISWVVGVFWSFIWNRQCVFQEGKEEAGSFIPSLLKAYCSYALTGIFLNNVLLYFEVSKLGISEVIAPVFVLIISIPVNFLLNKFWTFRSSAHYSKGEQS